MDTSGGACSLALFDGDALIAERHEQIGRGHAEALMPWIAEFPDGGRADTILVGCGPGSFTGVRVGVAAARALGLGWAVPVLGMDSLALIALSGRQFSSVLVAIEGGHGELFVRRYEGELKRPTTNLLSAKPDIIAEEYDDSVIVGNASGRLVTARGYGEAVEGDARASLAMSLAFELRNLPPTPIYGRTADATLPK